MRRRNTSLKSGNLERYSTLFRTGVSVRTFSVVYKIVEFDGAQRTRLLLILLERVWLVVEGVYECDMKDMSYKSCNLDNILHMILMRQ